MCGKADVLVTEVQVARRLGVSRDRARELSSLPDFPVSLGVITASSPPFSSVPFWRWDDIDAWAREHVAALRPGEPVAAA